MKAQRSHPCDDSRLELLLYDDDGSDAYRAAIDHLELCEACQRRLTALAGDENSWRDVRESLLEEPSGPQMSEAAWHKSLDFLAPSSHPQWLGRLGRYDIERVIGSGGMGIVLKGFDAELNRPVAIKVLAPHLSYSGAARQRFAREGRAAAAVVHEHVVAIHNVESEGEVPFLVMQYVAGESLQTRVERQGALGTHEMLRIAIQAAAGLAAAHEQGLVHRDIKPANLLLETGVERALLTDFGLARAMDDASLTHTGIVAGTPHYMSPEQADGRAVDHRSDLFSLGAVLYFMATGHPPFRAERPMAVLHRICRDRHRPVREINPDMPGELSAMIDRLLEKKPQRRPGSAVEIQQSLAELLSDIQQGRIRHRPMWRDRRKRWILTGGAFAGVLAASVCWIVVSLTRPDSSDPKFVVRPSLPVRNADSYSGDFMARLLSFDPGSEPRFDSEAAVVTTELNRLQSEGQVGDAFLQDSHDPWYAATKSIQSDLAELENSPYPDIDSQGDKQ